MDEPRMQTSAIANRSKFFLELCAGAGAIAVVSGILFIGESTNSGMTADEIRQNKTLNAFFLLIGVVLTLFGSIAIYVGLTRLSNSKELPKPCIECGGVVRRIDIQRSRNLFRFLERSLREEIKNIIVCEGCACGPRRWWCRDCKGEMSITWSPTTDAKAPACVHCSGTATMLKEIPAEVWENKVLLAAWIKSVPSADVAMKDREVNMQEKRRWIVDAVRGRDSKPVNYLGGHPELPLAMDAELFCIPDGLVVAGQTSASQGSQTATIINWPTIKRLEIQTHREGSDASKLQGMMIGTRTDAGALEGIAGLASIFAKGEHSVDILMIHVRQIDGIAYVVALKAEEAHALSGFLTSERGRLQALRSKSSSVLDAQSNSSDKSPPSLASNSDKTTMDSATGMKTCPMCAEDVKMLAKKCRHCGHMFD